MSAHARPEREEVMAPERRSYPRCDALMPLREKNRRTLVVQQDAVRLLNHLRAPASLIRSRQENTVQFLRA
jgi:hypothetical protein